MGLYACNCAKCKNCQDYSCMFDSICRHRSIYGTSTAEAKQMDREVCGAETSSREPQDITFSIVYQSVHKVWLADHIHVHVQYHAIEVMNLL